MTVRNHRRRSATHSKPWCWWRAWLRCQRTSTRHSSVSCVRQHTHTHTQRRHSTPNSTRRARPDFVGDRPGSPTSPRTLSCRVRSGPVRSGPCSGLCHGPDQTVAGRVWSCRFWVPLHGLTDFVCDPTIGTERTIYDQTDLSDTRAGLVWSCRADQTRPTLVPTKISLTEVGVTFGPQVETTKLLDTSNRTVNRRLGEKTGGLATGYALALQRESKKQDAKFLPITSPNVNRFSKFVHLQAQR